MRVVVCTKQISDPETTSDPVIGAGWRAGARAEILDDTDRYAVELGLQLCGDDGTVALVSFGAGSSEEGIRQALAMGADDAILVLEESDTGTDVLMTARALAAVIQETGYDLVITGTASTDGAVGVMTQMLGELLGVPAIGEVTRAQVDEGLLTVDRQTSGGSEVQSCSLPAVISVTAGAIEPRFPTIRGTMKSKRKQIDRRSLVEVVPDWAEMAKRLPAITSVEPAPEKPRGLQIEDDGTAEMAIITLLEEQGVL